MIRTSARKTNAPRAWLAVGLALVTLAAWAKGPAPSPREKYNAALEQLRAREKGELEPVYRLGLEAAAWLTSKLSERDEARAAGKTVKDFDEKLEGFAVSTEEVLYAVPEPAFFLELAKAKGQPADVGFFENRRLTYPSFPAWPVYREQQTDYSGCELFDAPELITVYRAWTEYAAKYPKAYVKEVKEQRFDIESMMTGATCACGKKEQVLAGFEAFIRAFPKAAITPKVKARLKSLKSEESDMVYACHSG
jgi:hypothetical protein